MLPLLATFTAWDTAILIVYLLGMVGMGFWLSRGQHDEETYFLGGRKMPTWAVALSVLATTLSAATFIGVPQIGFREDLTYLITNIGGVLAAVFLAFFVIPPLYNAGTLTIYGYLGKRFGERSMIAASGTFLVGRLLASGARLYMAGIAFSFLLFGDINFGSLTFAIILFGIVGTAYVALGGIKAVIWTDVVQIIILVGAALLTLVLLWNAMPADLDVLATLRNFGAAEGVAGQDKLALIDLTPSISDPFTLWGGIFIFFLILASFGVDHDLAQRMMATKSAWRGSASLIISTLLSIPVVLLFLMIGLLLAIFYAPELMGTSATIFGDLHEINTLSDDREVFPQFLVEHLPAGVSGLVMAGMFAAAMSSLDSAVNAMASSAIADIYEPLRRRRGHPLKSDAERMRASRVAVVVMGVLLTAFALLTIVIYLRMDLPLLNFALGVMSFAYAGLLGVFLAGIFTKRGNNDSVIAALVVGALVVLLLQPFIFEPIFGFTVAFTYWMAIATPISFLVCVSGSPKELASDEG